MHNQSTPIVFSEALMSQQLLDSVMLHNQKAGLPTNLSISVAVVLARLSFYHDSV